MSIIHLEFEKPIVELDEKIDALLAFKQSQDETTVVDIDEEIAKLRQKSLSLTRSIFSDLGIGRSYS
ncbi:acetyl-coenzyme A carboxylase carboxyl transferase subunit alpha [Proteus mirabilis]|uniref:Acetyl-coenzyme A carboxylase carboxyl transferase subunit alpha n=1 Tax=Proteus mirabilis TaxID=584 RepID=A0A379GID8_PROMI|nr:acetyl-coenzyme A carboxylase carboxyl transferase subunit alpha [Proteus mirabilis]